MKLHELLTMCENITPKTNVVLYHSLEDFENNTCHWNSARAGNLLHTNMRIVKFKVYETFVAVALA